MLSSISVCIISKYVQCTSALHVHCGSEGFFQEYRTGFVSSCVIRVLSERDVQALETVDLGRDSKSTCTSLYITAQLLQSCGE